MGRLITVASCALRQWALAWTENTDRIIESIQTAKAAGARLRVGPELEISGYSCNDHFLESDTYLHSLEMLVRILEDKSCYDILIDVGLPLKHRNVNYNVRALLFNGKVLCFRPKMHLANDGNFREMRWFTPWTRTMEYEDYHLPRMLQKLQGATHVPFGDCVISTPETCIGLESCEELWLPGGPHVPMSLDGVEVFTNSSASHFSLQKLNIRVSLIAEATRKAGGLYLYSNVQGCDGERIYFDGAAMIFLNGNLLAQSPQFSLNDVDVITATVDLEQIRSYRQIMSRNLQAAMSKMRYHRIQTPFELSLDEDDYGRPTLSREPKYHGLAEEVALCAGCYLWDYLARSGSAGYLVPLSGGLDSCATAVLVFGMCRLAISAMNDGNKSVIATLKRLFGDAPLPKTAQELCGRVFHTVYMGMSKQSSAETRQRAKDLSAAIGAYHLNTDIDGIYQAQKDLVSNTLGHELNFRMRGGTVSEGLVLQNIQARTRMVTAYSFAQALPMTRNLPGGGGLLVLGSANVGESLRGYLTKGDCSFADINPIGSCDKRDLGRLLAWAQESWELPVLKDFLTATPTAELEPVEKDYVQSDEVDMGMSYAELTLYGRLRKEQHMGPFSMFQHLVHLWGEDREDGPPLKPDEVADKVKRFFGFYAINRHKATTLTPSLHTNDYSCDDNRFDLRPFLYPSFWKSWSFKRIDREVARLAKERK